MTSCITDVERAKAVQLSDEVRTQNASRRRTRSFVLLQLTRFTKPRPWITCQHHHLNIQRATNPTLLVHVLQSLHLPLLLHALHRLSPHLVITLSPLHLLHQLQQSQFSSYKLHLYPLRSLHLLHLSSTRHTLRKHRAAAATLRTSRLSRPLLKSLNVHHYHTNIPPQTRTVTSMATLQKRTSSMKTSHRK